MIETILVATDGSEHARRAVDLGADLAAKYGARVILLHVLLRGHLPEGLLRAAQVEHVSRPSPSETRGLVVMPPEIMARVETSPQVPLDVLEFIGRKVMAEAAGVVRDKGVSAVETAVEQGDPAWRTAHRDRAEPRIKKSMGVLLTITFQGTAGGGRNS